MVGLVVVCHSRALARAAVALAAQMLHGRPVPIEIAAGLDETTFGTDAVAITDAVTAADQGDGVVVLMDLGSAVLSAELALELLTDDLRERVVLSQGPFVEGLVAATVAAAAGADRHEVAGEAAAGLAGKQSHLGAAPASGERPGTSTGTGTGAAATMTVQNRHGLHARPAARLVAEVRVLDAGMEIRNRSTGSPWVPASSLSRVATLGALRGHEIEVRASGPRARDAVDHVVALAARAFDEPTETTAPPPATAPGTTLATAGLPASPGIAIGPAWQWRAVVPDIPDVPSRGPAAEWERISGALGRVRRDLHRIRAGTARDAGENQAAIFDAHLLLLEDADLLGDVRSRIAQGSAAPQAWSGATDRIAGEFEALADPYLKERAADVRAVAAQTLRALLETPGADLPDAGPAPSGAGPTPSAAGPTPSGAGPAPSAAGPTPSGAGPTPSGAGPDGAAARRRVLIAPDLTPAEAAGIDPEHVGGVLLAFGGPTSHAAILARTRGIPAVVGLGPAILEVPAGTPVALDGATGEVVVAPAGPALTAFRERADDRRSRGRRAATRASAPAVTRDGTAIAVCANVGSPADARAAAASGADSAGLVRTEFLFLGRAQAPDVDEQEAAYREIAKALGGRRITLRTVDVGGDKPLPYLPAAAEDNPFLGVRGIRHSLEHPALLGEQLTAIVRLANDTPVSVMFPMVSTVDEVVRARRILDEAIMRAGRGSPAGLLVGIMVEVPAAALKAARFAPYVDFVSIGTNDLTQYALAAERGNAALAPLADGFDPGVLRLVDAVCRGADGRFPVAVCGELAGDETAVPLLVGLGVRELSVAPGLIPSVKVSVRSTRVEVAAATAAQCLDLSDAAAVRALLATEAADSAVPGRNRG